MLRAGTGCEGESAVGRGGHQPAAGIVAAGNECRFDRRRSAAGRPGISAIQRIVNSPPGRIAETCRRSPRVAGNIELGRSRHDAAGKAEIGRTIDEAAGEELIINPVEPLTQPILHPLHFGLKRGVHLPGTRIEGGDGGVPAGIRPEIGAQHLILPVLAHSRIFQGGRLSGSQRHIVSHGCRASVHRLSRQSVNVAENGGSLEDAPAHLPVAVPVADFIVGILTQASPPVGVGLIPVPAGILVAIQIIGIAERKVVIPNRRGKNLTTPVFIKVGGEPIAINLLHYLNKPPVIYEGFNIYVRSVSVDRISEAGPVERSIEGIDVICQISGLRSIQDVRRMGMHTHRQSSIAV